MANEALDEAMCALQSLAATARGDLAAGRRRAYYALTAAIYAVLSEHSDDDDPFFSRTEDRHAR